MTALIPLKGTLASLYNIRKNNKQNLPDPDFTTWHEFHDIINEHHKWHEDDSYEGCAKAHTAAYSYNNLEKHTILLRQKIIAGIRFQFRASITDRSNNREIHPSDWMISAFDMDTRRKVGAVQDEWGCMLITVAPEYRGFGIASELTDLTRRERPYWVSGGFTSHGRTNARSYHARRIRRAMTNGTYSRAVRDGTITASRAREIIASLPERHKKTVLPDLSLSPVTRYMLYHNGYGDYCLYDPKLAWIFKNQQFDPTGYWQDRFLLGHAHISGKNGDRLYHLSGATNRHAAIMMAISLEHASKEQTNLIVPEAYTTLIQDGKHTVSEPTIAPGSLSRIVTPGKTPRLIPYMTAMERQFRRKFDQYNEFEIFMQESINAMTDFAEKTAIAA